MLPMQKAPHALGRLELGPRLAVGGMGEVFRATVELDGREVDCVVKALLPGVGEIERALFAREARALAALTRLPARRFAHLLGVDGEGERLIVEFIEGPDLATVLAHRKKRGRPMPVAAVLALGVALAEALVELEAAEEGGRRLGLVHRDLHPGNVVVGRDGAVKVIDLGVSTFAALEATSANPRGTLAYMAPEQLREGQVSAASDVYAVGLMLWEALVGEPARPAGDGSLGELLAYRQRVPEAASGRRAGVPAALDAWVMRALAVPAEARPSAAELLEGLRAVAAEAGAGEAALATVVEPLIEAGQAVRPAPTLRGGRVEVAGGARNEAVRIEVVPAEAGGAEAGAGVEARRRGVGLVALVVAVVMTATAVSVGAPELGVGPPNEVSGGAGSGSMALGSTAVDNVGSERRARSEVGPTNETAQGSLEVGSIRLDSARQGWASVLERFSVAAVGGSLAPTAPRSTVLGNASEGEGERAGEMAGAGEREREGEGLAARSGPTSPRSTVLDNARKGPASGHTPKPTALTVLPLDGPLHVSGLGARDLAPQTTSLLAPSTSGLLRLTGGSPPLTALVRVAHVDGGLTATVGAPPGEVYEVTCGGRPRPTPAAGLTIGLRLACKVTTADGRSLAFALRPR